MSTTVETEQDHTGTELQFATFYVGDLLLGVNICQVQEINRQLDATKVPHAPKEVHGVINLRGDVATVIDLRTVLGMPPVEDSRNSRTLIVQSHGESIGILVDRISDILTISSEEIGRRTNAVSRPQTQSRRTPHRTGNPPGDHRRQAWTHQCSNRPRRLRPSLRRSRSRSRRRPQSTLGRS